MHPIAQSQPLKLFIGIDLRQEPVVYHTFCHSVIEKMTRPVSFHPLVLHTLPKALVNRDDGTNAFTYSRFLVPYLCDFTGHALYVDGDMLCRDDIHQLVDEVDLNQAVSVVQHDYKTKHPVKYCGHKNLDYPRKNWSSVMFWNCEHPQNKQLTPQFVASKSGWFLHRFSWLDDNDIGELPDKWNWLVAEYPYNEQAKLVHYTIGAPCFDSYKECDYASEWWETYYNLQQPQQITHEKSKR